MLGYIGLPHPFQCLVKIRPIRDSVQFGIVAFGIVSFGKVSYNLIFAQ